MTKITVRKFGKSLGVILPKEVIRRLHTWEGEHPSRQFNSLSVSVHAASR
jgi:antitoxin component of MazEF toxin-antitoxin module